MCFLIADKWDLQVPGWNTWEVFKCQNWLQFQRKEDRWFWKVHAASSLNFRWVWVKEFKMDFELFPLKVFLFFAWEENGVHYGQHFILLVGCCIVKDFVSVPFGYFFFLLAEAIWTTRCEVQRWPWHFFLVSIKQTQ